MSFLTIPLGTLQNVPRSITYMSIKLVLLLLIAAGALWWCWSQWGPVDGINRDLLSAANGNKKLAKRLLEQTRKCYPDKSERWCVEKTIYDLNRDRGVIKARPSKMAFLDFRTMTRREMREKIIFVGLFVWMFETVSGALERWFR
jgi:hypothetical protein